MKTLYIALICTICLLFAGCPTMSMSPEQLKASAGMATCGTATTMYGKTSIITAAADDIRKGQTDESSTEIICGDSSMKLTTKVGASASVPKVKPSP